MALNSDEHHPAHSVSDYFEVLKLKSPSLYLLKDELEKTKITNQLQKESAMIDVPGRREGKSEKVLIESKDDKTKQDNDIKIRNQSIFNKQFPG